MEQANFQTFDAIGVERAATTAPRRTAFDPRLKPVYVGLGLSAAFLSIALPASGLMPDIVLPAFLVVCGVFVWVAACLRMRGLSAMAMVVESWTLFALSCLFSMLATFAVARAGAPLADPWMAAADRIVAPGFDWRETVLATTRHPMLMTWANRAYGSLQWQSSALILLCAVTGHSGRTAAFLLRWTIALAIVAVIFAFLPCLGPYAHYGIAHSAVPTVHSSIGWRQPELLAALRTHGPMHLELDRLDGIVEFPSFHTTAAILFVWGFWPIRWVRWPMLVINLAMIASAVPVGGHYYVDILSGAVVAWVAIMAPLWAQAWSLRK
jgi:membrane-associated phospholipid phosphatase